MQIVKICMLMLLSLALSAQADGHKGDHEAGSEEGVLNLQQIAQAFGWDMENVEITTEKVADGLYVLFGVGGNIGVLVGDDGVMIVDNQFPQVMDKIEKAIQNIGGNGIDYAINTHWHFDHAESNNVLGPKGATIVAHAKARADMSKGGLVNLVVAKYRQQAYPEVALPTLTYDDGMQIQFNGGQVDLMHFSPAHTTGDSAVYFRKYNAVHLGDVFNNSGYPFIDVDSGGDINGMINFCQKTLDAIGPDAIVIPGHGPITDSEALARYIYMLTTVRDRVAAMIADGKSLEEVVEAKITAEDFDQIYGPESASAGFINRVYTSLTR